MVAEDMCTLIYGEAVREPANTSDRQNTGDDVCPTNVPITDHFNVMSSNLDLIWITRNNIAHPFPHWHKIQMVSYVWQQRACISIL